MNYRNFKRILDICLSIFLVITLAPVLVFSIVYTYFFVDRNPLFYQLRAGYQLKPFVLVKLKTMKTTANESSSPLLSKIFRALGIDELFSIYNIIRGDMSFIGPRPLPVAFSQYFYPYELRRFSILPGISGLAQVSGRNLLSWSDRFLCDVQYSNNLSFTYDLKIFILTLFKLAVPFDYKHQPVKFLANLSNTPGRFSSSIQLVSPSLSQGTCENFFYVLDESFNLKNYLDNTWFKSLHRVEELLTRLSDFRTFLFSVSSPCSELPSGYLLGYANSDSFFISIIAISTAHQRLGLGRDLIAYVENFVSNVLLLSSVTLKVYADNYSALSFYQSQGYINLSVISAVDSKPSSILLSKTLT